MATFLEKDNREVLIMSKINEVAELVEKGKAKLVGPAVQEAIDEGDDPVAILNDGMISAMSIVGDKFKNVIRN